MQETTTGRPSMPSKFRPTHEELIHHYLYKKVNGEPLPNNDTVREYDLYGQKEPWEIWEMFGGPTLEKRQFLYFFTRLKRKSPKSSRISRRVGMGTGTWKGETAAKEINASGVMGLRKMFKYGASGTPQDGRWIMHEYSLVSSSLQQKQSNDYVLCRIKKASEKKRKSREKNLEKLGNLQESGREKKPNPKPIKNEEVFPEIQVNQQMELTCTKSIEPAQSHETVDTNLQQQNRDGVAVGSTDVALMEPLSSIDELFITFEGFVDSEKKMSRKGNTGTKATKEQPCSDKELMGLVLLPLASQPASPIAPGGANKEVENRVDCTGFIETNAPVETYYGDEHYNDEAKSFAKELLKNQPPNAMEEDEIIMLPNMYFMDNWVRGWEPVPLSHA